MINAVQLYRRSQMMRYLLKQFRRPFKRTLIVKQNTGGFQFGLLPEMAYGLPVEFILELSRPNDNIWRQNGLNV